MPTSQPKNPAKNKKPNINSVFSSQVENLKLLESAWSHLRRSVNQAYTRNDLQHAKIQTKLMALLFCAYSESIFLKLIYTPNALSQSQINSILAAAKNNVYSGWISCIEVSCSRVNDVEEPEMKEFKKTLKSLVDEYIKEPSLVRNKIAHGQWAVALNSKNTKPNQELTNALENLDIVKLQVMYNSISSLFSIMQDLISSPNNAHGKFHKKHLENHLNNKEEMKSWTLEKRIASLKQKRSHTKRTHCSECEQYR